MAVHEAGEPTATGFGVQLTVVLVVWRALLPVTVSGAGVELDDRCRNPPAEGPEVDDAYDAFTVCEVAKVGVKVREQLETGEVPATSEQVVALNVPPPD